MNLIEQLGGYENARERLKRENVLTDSDYNYGQRKLLEYRRQHNIFEVGDKVVFEACFCDEHEGSGYGEITYSTMNKRVFEIDNYYIVFIEEIRHATGGEIKVGKRLEVTK